MELYPDIKSTLSIQLSVGWLAGCEPDVQADRICPCRFRIRKLRLIRDVEIGYFRSFEKIRVKNLNDASILFGRNDSGKSNFVRAINLFFNNETGPGLPINFDIDLSNRRLEKENVRKFVYVKIEFNTPPSYRKSLGKSFWVKRQWTVGRGNEFHQELAKENNSTHKKKSISRLLNQMKFSYIPAVKDRSIFSRLLHDIYSILAADKDFRTSLTTFAQEIRQRTDGLSTDLRELLSFASSIAPPTDMGAIFRALDFDTRGDRETRDVSLTLQRGDGIQVRHVPALLKFIAERDDKNYHVWGFEEPENSLEFASACQEAKVLADIAATDLIQVFVTSHSPAFYNLEKETVSKFFVSRGDVSEITRLDSSVSLDHGELMGDGFYLPLISEKVAGLQKEVEMKSEQIAHAKAQTEELKERLAKIGKPVLFVEGQSDRHILEVAWKTLNPGLEMPFVVEDAGGTQKMKALAVDGDTLGVAANNRKIFVLVDHDKAGKELAHGKVEQDSWMKVPNGTFWKFISSTDEAESIARSLGINSDQLELTIEDCFSGAFRQIAAESGCYELGNTKEGYRDPKSFGVDPATFFCNMKETPLANYYVLSTKGQTKTKFSEWVACNLNDHKDQLCYFDEFFKSLLGELEGL